MAVALSVGSTLGDVLGSALGDGLGSVLGDGLGSVLGDVLGSALGDGLGSALGDGLGSALGDVLGTGVGFATPLIQMFTEPLASTPIRTRESGREMTVVVLSTHLTVIFLKSVETSLLSSEPSHRLPFLVVQVIVDPFFKVNVIVTPFPKSA